MRVRLFRNVLMMFVAVVFMAALPIVNVDAKTSGKLSAKNRTLSIGQEYTLKLKHLSKKDRKSAKKVKWAVSDKRILAVKKKTQYGITVHAKTEGTAKIIGRYKGKKYTCKVRVNAAGKDTDDAKSEIEDGYENGDRKLNATDVSIYFIRESEKEYLQPNPKHNYSFQFKVSGLKKDEDVDWSIESDSDICCFKEINGKVYMWRAPGYTNPEETAYLVAELEDGTKLKAKLHGYSEINAVIDGKIVDFKNRYITDGMTETEKLDAIATYVSTEYRYVLYQSDWMYMVVSGGGDCFSSRWFVKYLCEAVGIKALACVGTGMDGTTLAKADGEMYIVVTGFNTQEKGRYLLYKPNESTLQRVVATSKIDMAYFD